ncbi:MAG: hypothetical protein JW750_05755 [Anaerolineaceae bacterium]|nr:hypothetical protein [Anaerolineaceae bacterium]
MKHFGLVLSLMLILVFLSGCQGSPLADWGLKKTEIVRVQGMVEQKLTQTAEAPAASAHLMQDQTAVMENEAEAKTGEVSEDTEQVPVVDAADDPPDETAQDPEWTATPSPEPESASAADSDDEKVQPTQTPTGTKIPTETADSKVSTSTQPVKHTATNTKTLLAATQTSIPPTKTSAPPTATKTSAPPTATKTTAPTATKTSAPPTATQPPAGCDDSTNGSYESQVIVLINQERAAQGLSALSGNSALTSAARRHSKDMACNGIFSHTGSDGSTPFSRMLDAGYAYSAAAENIYAGGGSSNSPAAAVSAWMASTGHRANILGAAYVDIGIGYVYSAGSPYGGYYTANFGAP